MSPIGFLLAGLKKVLVHRSTSFLPRTFASLLPRLLIGLAAFLRTLRTLGLVFRSDLARAIRVHTLKDLSALFIRQLAEKFSFAELLEAQSAALIHVKCPELLLRFFFRVFPHFSNFIATDHSVRIPVQAFEDFLAFVLGNTLETRTGEKFIFGDLSIPILVHVFEDLAWWAAFLVIVVIKFLPTTRRTRMLAVLAWLLLRYRGGNERSRKNSKHQSVFH